MDHDTINLKHFVSRANRPHSAAPPTQGFSGANVYVIHDVHPTSLDLTDDARFRYIGTSPHLTHNTKICSRVIGQHCMASLYH